ncbi:GTPase IMAP family member GIMD1 [Protopterus annectens]|uniref:GTPase IMAP family member GIMD1 n=1 Tax=Protopterus annectens TaxID=7888 RepID=UPI001CF95C03|nr:GTPase IMAP family member GIMD1 [Protopterus annectens]
MTGSELLTLNFLLLGRTQSGKSAMANCLLGSYELESKLSASSVTQECKLQTACLSNFCRRNGSQLNLRINVMDTPGCPHPTITKERLKQTVNTALQQHFHHGLHMALLVMRGDVPFCEEDCQVIQFIKDLLGPEWNYHTTVIFSHEDRITDAGFKNGQDYLRTAPDTLLELLDSIQNKFHFVNYRADFLKEEQLQILNKLFYFIIHNGYKSLEFK